MIVDLVRKEGRRWVVECLRGKHRMDFVARTLPAALALAERHGVDIRGVAA